MPEFIIPSALHAQELATTQALRQCNALSSRYGLALTETQIQALVNERFQSLVTAGRVEFVEGVLPRLIYAFCDSPYIQRNEYFQTLCALQDLFYTFKNELEDCLTDDDLIEALKQLFDNKAQGSLEYLENLTVSDLCRALRKDTQEDNDEYDD